MATLDFEQILAAARQLPKPFQAQLEAIRKHLPWQKSRFVR